MNEAEARSQLERMTAAADEPKLLTGDITQLLSMSALADGDGRPPSDLAWEPNWDLNRGAAEGWRWKAAKLATKFDFDADGGRYSRSQMLQMCLDMAMQYQRKIAATVQVRGASAY